MALTRDQIKACEDRPLVPVPGIPGWPGGVYVQAMTSEEHAGFELATAGKSDANAEADPDAERKAALTLYARACVKCCKNEHGDRVFHDGDEDWLSKKNAAAIRVIFAKISEIHGWTKADLEKLIKNSVSAAGSGS